MKRTHLPMNIRRLLDNTHYATIATTCPDGMPWNTPVSAYFDEDMNLYWSSYTQSQHSRNILTQPVIFAVVCDVGAGLGLYMQLEAKELRRLAEVDNAKRVYLDRIGEHGHEPFIGECPRRLYRATLKKAWINAEGDYAGHYIDTRREL